jgi:hypothetical protein
MDDANPVEIANPAKRRRRRLWLVPLAAVVICAAAALAWTQRGAAWVLPELQARVLAATGLRLEVEGPVVVRFVPWGLQADRVRLVSADAAGSPPLIYADALDVDLSWASLLRGRVDIARAHLSQVRALAAGPPVDVEVVPSGGAAVASLSAGQATLRLSARRSGDTLILDDVMLEDAAHHLAASGTGRLSFGDPIRLIVNAALKQSGVPLGAAALALGYSTDGLVIDRADWRRPDGLDVSLFGHAAAVGGDLRLEGGLGASSQTDKSFDASAEFAGTFGAHGLDMTLDNIAVSGGAGRLTGEAKLHSGTPAAITASLKLDRLDVDAIKHSALAQLVGLVAGAGVDAEAAVHVLVDRVAAGGKTVAEGIVLDAAQHGGTFDLNELSARSLAGLPLHASGRVALGPAPVAAFDPIHVTFGQTEANGRLRIDLSGPRPLADGELATGPLRLDGLWPSPPPLPPVPMTRRAVAAAKAKAKANANAKAAAPTAASAWPQTPFALPASFPVDADLSITSPRVAWRSYGLDQVRAHVTVREAQVAVSELTAAAYGGQVAFSGRLEHPDHPHLAANLRLTAANLGRVLADAGFDNIAGRGDVTADLAADGDSAAALVATLAGTVTVAARNGEISGIDLPMVSQRLKAQPKRPTDILQMARFAAGGRTPFSELRGELRIDQGIARTSNVRLKAADGQAHVQGSIDLPHRTLHLVAEFGLTDPPDMPPLVINLDGALAEPRRVFDISRLQSYLLHRGGIGTPARR